MFSVVRITTGMTITVRTKPMPRTSREILHPEEYFEKKFTPDLFSNVPVGGVTRTLAVEWAPKVRVLAVTAERLSQDREPRVRLRKTLP